MPVPLPPRMTEIVSTDYETQRVQRNAADAVNSVIGNLTSPLGFTFPGPLRVSSLNVGGVLNAASAIIQGALTSGSLVVSGATLLAATTIGGVFTNNGLSFFSSTVGPFYLNGVAIGAGGTTQSTYGVSNSAIFPFAPVRAGSIVGVSGFTSLATGTSTVTITAVKNGAPTSVTSAAAVGTSSTIIGNIYPKGTVPFVPGDNIRLDVSSSTAATVSGTFTVHLEFTP